MNKKKKLHDLYNKRRKRARAKLDGRPKKERYVSKADRAKAEAGVITIKNTGVFMKEEQAEQIAEQWLTHAAESAGQKDLKGHMGMISKRVSVQGVPGFDNIDYDKWYVQCRHQFEMAMIKSVAYKGFNFISATESLIVFTVFEVVVGTDGTLNEQIVEMSLEKEDDDVWRLVLERVLIENDAMRNHELSKE